MTGGTRYGPTYSKKNNIQPLDPAGARFIQYNSEKQRIHTRQVHRRRAKLIYGVAGIFCSVIMVTGVGNYLQLRTAEARSLKVEQQVEKAKSENKRLVKLKNNLQNEDYVEQYVRQHYMYTKKGEVIFNLPDK
ncbi:septum formation initiator [Weissella koreensis KACC 15510]|uniref:FtsB family cell division protein n=1 Tax=Weissella koreensis TaxID=165096 RepID=UPI000217440C|nr:septum formation initiator family protein [Weissella koreensis]AEJ23698.1 septum formation initiator [Weissella koreensis KACC 15510]